MQRGDEAVGLIVSLQCGFQREWVANELTERVGMEARRIESDPGGAGDDRCGRREPTA